MPAPDPSAPRRTQPAAHTGPHTGPQSAYQAPSATNQKVLNGAISAAIRLGARPRGAMLLQVPRRRSGGIQQIPVNPLDVDSHRFLVAPRGQTEWVRNLRSAGTCGLRSGRHTTDYLATELTNDVKAPLLRAYLARWSAETARFFEPLTKDSSDADIAELAWRFPVFEIVEAGEQ